MNEATRVMVDIETLGLERDSAIVSVGALAFDEDGLGEEFSRSVSLESCQDAGLSVVTSRLGRH